jgi:hypothetical protein
VAHACNSNYSGGRDQEVPSQPREIVPQDLISKKKSQKEGTDGMAQGIGPEFKPQYYKKKIASQSCQLGLCSPHPRTVDKNHVGRVVNLNYKVVWPGICSHSLWSSKGPPQEGTILCAGFFPAIWALVLCHKNYTTPQKNM